MKVIGRAQFIALVIGIAILCLFYIPQSNVSAPTVPQQEKPTLAFIPDVLIPPGEEPQTNTIKEIIEKTKDIIAPKPVFKGWSIRGVSSMKETKDKICNPDNEEFVKKWVEKAKELGVNYISVETPYDEISCGSNITYTKLWVDTIHNEGLHVWHRHMPVSFEGIYGAKKDNTKNYLSIIQDYILSNPKLFKEDDIFSPIPEPQNGGIQGINTCQQNVCMFSDVTTFNAWLRDAMNVSRTAFGSIGLQDKIKVGYYGFDGYIVWGSNNNNWHGILEDATVKTMGNITIDHYPQAIGTSMKDDLDKLQQKYPKTQIIIGEWGSISKSSPAEDQINEAMTAAERPKVIGFNYWHLGMGGTESLITDDFVSKPGFDAVKSHFMKQW